MTTKADLIAAVQAAADAYYVANPKTGAAVKLSIGSTGTVVTIAGQKFNSGSAWANVPGVLDTEVEGLADWLDASGIGGVGTIKSKVNELVLAYVQLRSDYNAGTVPTTAPVVVVIP